MKHSFHLLLTFALFAASLSAASNSNPRYIDPYLPPVPPIGSPLSDRSMPVPRYSLTTQSAYSATGGEESDYSATADNPLSNDALPALAASLGNDPIRIYEWVRNNIRSEFYYGCNRGAYLTLLDRAGNDMDQCALLGALLKASNITVNYRYGTAYLPRSATGPNRVGMYELLGVNDDASISHILATGFGQVSETPTGWKLECLGLYATIPGRGQVWMAPYLKPHRIGSRTDVSTLAGYSRSSAISSAGGTAGSSSSWINRGSLKGYLNTLATAASNGIRSSVTMSSLSAAELANIPVVTPELTSVVRPTASAYPENVTFLTSNQARTAIRHSWCSRIYVKVGNSQWDAEMPDLVGRSLVVEFDGSGGGILRLNGAPLFTDNGGGVGASVEIELVYQYPSGWSAEGDTPPLVSAKLATKRERAVALLYSFGRCSNRLRDAYSVLADRQARGETITDSDRLNLEALQYASQTNELAEMAAASLGHRVVRQFHGGFTFFRNGLPNMHIGINHAFIASASASALSSISARSTVSLLMGALEGTAVEQMSGGRGFGTPSLFDQGMELQRGGRYITSTSQLSGLVNFDDPHLGSGSVADIQSHLNNQGHVFLLDNSDVPFNGVSRGGYYRIYPTYGGVATVIAGLNGGSGSFWNSVWSAIKNFGTKIQKIPANVRAAFSSDPVDLGTGAFYKEDTDLVLGDGGAPIGLQLVRHYSSDRRTQDPVGLGRGWTHSYHQQLQMRHPDGIDAEEANFDEVVPLLLAARVTQDLLAADPQSARAWMMASTIMTWAVDQQLNTRASVTLGARQLDFIKRPDGTFVPPGSLTASLVENSTTHAHTLSFRHGNTIEFYPLDSDPKAGKFHYITDPFGNTLTAAYTTQGKLQTVTDARNRTLTFNQPGATLDSVSDSTGRTVSYTRDSVGLKVTDAEGKQSTLEQDGDGRLTKIIDARGRTVVQNFYDNWHRVKEQYILGDSTHRNRLWIAPGVGAEVDPAGKAVWTYFDARGRKIFVVNQDNKISQWHYDGADRLTDFVTPEGNVTSYVYDANHNLTQETNPAGHTRTVEYDSSLRPWKVSNFEGQITEFEYNAQHKVTKITAPGGILSTFEYHTSGNGKGKLSKAHPAAYESGKFDFYSYDASGNVKWIERGVASSTSSGGTATPTAGTYDAFVATARGDITESIDRRGVKTTFSYNARRQRTGMTTWTGTIDAQGLVTAPYVANGTTTTAYDDTGDVASVLDASSRKTATEHNALGDVTEVRQGPLNGQGIPAQIVLKNDYNTRNLLYTSKVPYDGADRTTTFDYYDTQELKSVENPLNKKTSFGYDGDQRRTTTTTPLGNISTTTWDSRGYKDYESDGESRLADYTYDKDGRPTLLGNRRYSEHHLDFSWEYDDTNRKITTKTPRQQPDGPDAGKATISTLNTRGLPDSIKEPSTQTTTFSSYDAEGRLLEKSDGEGTTTYAYWPNGLLKTVVEGTKTTTRTYDAQNRLSEYKYADTANTATNYTIGYTYYPSGELKELIYPGSKTVTYTYDDFGRLYQVKDWTNKTTTYTYWENGLLKKIERPNGTTREQSYDAAGQLRTVRETKAGAFFAFQQLTYDDDGRITKSFLHPMPAAVTLPADDMLFDADNRMSSFNGDTGVTYDADGNLTRGPALTGSVPGTANFTYNVRNRLTSHGGSFYRYNPDGLRVEVTGTGAATYVVDPNPALSRTLIRTKGGVTTYYIYGLGLLYECDAAGNSAKYYHADQVGSTVALTDASGTITDRWSYAPFGTEFRVGSGTSDTPFRFNGEFGVMTEASGLVYMRARYYHPRLMRFLNADPVGFAGGLNWYTFAGNNPISFLDPTGFDRTPAQKWDGVLAQLDRDLDSIRAGTYRRSWANKLRLVGKAQAAAQAWDAEANGLVAAFPGEVVDATLSKIGFSDDEIWAINMGLIVGSAGEFAIGEFSGFFAAESGVMFSKNLGSAGPRASAELLDAMRAHGRTITIATEGSEELRFLNAMGAEASVGGPQRLSILLRENPSQAAAIEEFLHGTQTRLGIVDRLGVQGAEAHVESFMTRYTKLLGLEPK